MPRFGNVYSVARDLRIGVWDLELQGASLALYCLVSRLCRADVDVDVGRCGWDSWSWGVE